MSSPYLQKMWNDDGSLQRPAASYDIWQCHTDCMILISILPAMQQVQHAFYFMYISLTHNFDVIETKSRCLSNLPTAPLATRASKYGGFTHE